MWHIRRFEALSLEELEEIYLLRQTVFILEQKSLFADIDGEDREAVHIFHKDEGVIISYCRITTDGKIVIGLCWSTHATGVREGEGNCLTMRSIMQSANILHPG